MNERTVKEESHGEQSGNHIWVLKDDRIYILSLYNYDLALMT